MYGHLPPIQRRYNLITDTRPAATSALVMMIIIQLLKYPIPVAGKLSWKFGFFREILRLTMRWWSALRGWDTLHYRLRSIKEVQFGFAHFVSHFIRVQIFQIEFPLILSASKYFRWISLSFYICREQN